MDNKRNTFSQGDIRRLWAESFDKEMDRFLLMPIDDSIDCNSCPENQNRLFKKRVELNFIQAITRSKDRVRNRFWLWVLRWIETEYAGSARQDAGQVADGVLAIRDALVK